MNQHKAFNLDAIAFGQLLTEAAKHAIWCDKGVKAIVDLAPQSVDTAGFKQAERELHDAVCAFRCLLDTYIDPDLLLAALSIKVPVGDAAMREEAA